MLSLTAPSGLVLLFNDDTNGLDPEIEATLVVGGAYQLAVSSYPGPDAGPSTVSTGPYELSAQCGQCADQDWDGICDSADNCRLVENADQSNADFDAFGDACDLCAGSGTSDADRDGRCDGNDNCPLAQNLSQQDSDLDNVGDACDACYGSGTIDTDRDGRCDRNDNCPVTGNPGQSDADGDGWGDSCDNCPATQTSNTVDSDRDGVGDPCDNCPMIATPSQSDVDRYGQGDVCDLGDDQPLFTFLDEISVVWQQELGSAFNLYRGDLATLFAGGAYTQTPGDPSSADRFCGLTDRSAKDPAVPTAGNAFFYLVTVVRDGIERSLGTSSEGVERPNANPCP